MNRIKEVLQEKGIRQSALARRVGLSRSAISQFCLNDAQPRLPVLFDIAKALDVLPADLIGDGSEIE